MAGTPGQVAAPSLTRREREVSRLVKEGLSNKEIALKLFLSERTIEGHVASICNKLGFHSRVQIAAWVAQQGGASTGGHYAPSNSERRRGFLPPPWVLAIMAAGTPLPFIAVIYQWSQPADAGLPAVAVNVLVSAAALAFVAVPAISLTGLATDKRWSAPLAAGGLLATGSVVLLVGIASQSIASRAGNPFHAADPFESVYAASLVPLLLMHALAAAFMARRHPLSRFFVSAVCVVWIVRFGYGLTLATLVLWLLWSHSTKARLVQ